jgi:hypothetical protein
MKYYVRIEVIEVIEVQRLVSSMLAYSLGMRSRLLRFMANRRAG